MRCDVRNENSNSLTFPFQFVHCSQSHFKLFNDALSKCQPDNRRGLEFSLGTFHQHAPLMCRKRGRSEGGGLRYNATTTTSLATTCNRQRCVSSQRMRGSEDGGQRAVCDAAAAVAAVAAVVEADSGASGQRACSCKHVA